MLQLPVEKHYHTPEGKTAKDVTNLYQSKDSMNWHLCWGTWHTVGKALQASLMTAVKQHQAIKTNVDFGQNLQMERKSLRGSHDNIFVKSLEISSAFVDWKRSTYPLVAGNHYLRFKAVLFWNHSKTIHQSLLLYQPTNLRLYDFYLASNVDRDTELFTNQAVSASLFSVWPNFMIATHRITAS